MNCGERLKVYYNMLEINEEKETLKLYKLDFKKVEKIGKLQR